jgi:hypothetical protein
MPEAYAVRVLDALNEGGPSVRSHDGTQVDWTALTLPHTTS